MLVVSMRMEDSSLTGIFNDPQVYADSYNSLSTDSGAVVVYSVEENEVEGAIPKYRWTVEAVLKGAWMDIRDYFGTAVAADGNTVVVSAAGEDSGPLASPIHGVPEGFVPDNNHDACGAVYVFVRDEETGNWTQQAFLKPPTCEGAGFGKGISLLGNVLVVSSDHDVQYVYVRNEVSQEWSFKEQLQPSTKEEGVWQYFGISHSMTSEDLLLVGSPYENSRLTGVNYGDDIPFINNASHAGAAFLFVRNDTNEQSWTQLAMLKASNTREQAEFGRAVVYNKGLFAIGAVLEETNIPGITYGEPTDAGGASRRIGAVYVFSSSFEPCKGSVTAASSSINFECIGGRWHSFDSVTVRKEETTRRRQEDDVQLLVDSADSIAVDGFLRIVNGATVRMKVGTESRNRKNPVLYLGGCADIFGTLEVEIDPSVTAPTEVTLLRQDPSCVPLEAFNITAAHDYALCSSSFQTSFDESTGHLSVLVHPELLEASSPSCVPVDGSNSGSTSSSSSVPDEAREEGEDDENTVAIVVPSVIGGLLLLLAVVAVVVVALFFVRRKKNEKQRNSVVMLEDPEQGGEQNYAAVSTPSSKKSKNSKIVPRKRGATTSFGLNYNDLEFGEEIGHGSFGVVYQGKWRLTPVAIKLLNQLKEEQLDDFQKEVELMQNIRPHSNVVQLLGVCVDPQYPLCIVTELMPGGSLDAFLKSPKGQQLTHPEMIRIAMGITAGMQHLHSENIIHCDLAARNVLLNNSLDAKVADFGMARVLSAEDEQHQTLANVGPIRWMAPESMKDQVYSAKSDAWSFGVVLFEIASFGELPYEELANLQVSLAVVSEGRRLEPPKDAPKVFVELMSMCFATQPEDRPNFTSMNAMLSDALEEM
ncbi:CLL4A clavata1-like receptor S/T protein kinase protein [Balamuthia mandrillaris]